MKETNDKPVREEKNAVKEALLKMADLCARSEQCAFDIARKLRLKGLTEDETEIVLSQLERRKFLDSSRFARSFANDKMRFSGWGRVKIRVGLLQKRIPEADIAAALEELDEVEYENILMNAARAKAHRLDLSDYATRVKLMRSLMSRGFTSSEVSRAVTALRNEERD